MPIIRSTWYGIAVRVDKVVDNWVNVMFLESCTHFKRNEKVTLSRYNIKSSVVLLRRSTRIHRTPCVAGN